MRRQREDLEKEEERKRFRKSHRGLTVADLQRPSG